MEVENPPSLCQQLSANELPSNQSSKKMLSFEQSTVNQEQGKMICIREVSSKERHVTVGNENSPCDHTFIETGHPSASGKAIQSLTDITVDDSAEGDMVRKGPGASLLMESEPDSNTLITVNKALATYKHTTGGNLSVAEQSAAENIYMQYANQRNAQVISQCLDCAPTQPGNNKKPPLTRAKAKHLVGGQQTDSLSQ